MSESTSLECPICFENYIYLKNAPVLFPCGHSCCIICATSIVSRPLASRLCHQCRNHIPDDTKLTINYALLDNAVERASIAASIEPKPDASKFDGTISVCSSVNIAANSTKQLQDLSVEDVANLMRHLNLPSGDIEKLRSKQVSGCKLEQCNSLDDIKECGVSLSIKAKSLYKIITSFKVSGVPTNFLSCSTSQDMSSSSFCYHLANKALERLQSYRSCGLEGIYYCNASPLSEMFRMSCDHHHFFHKECLADYLKVRYEEARAQIKPLACPSCEFKNLTCACPMCQQDNGPQQNSGPHIIQGHELKCIGQDLLTDSNIMHMETLVTLNCLRQNGQRIFDCKCGMLYSVDNLSLIHI